MIELIRQFGTRDRKERLSSEAAPNGWPEQASRSVSQFRRESRLNVKSPCRIAVPSVPGPACKVFGAAKRWATREQMNRPQC